MNDDKRTTAERPQDHPLYPVLIEAIDQAMHGKGERHGGASVPWLTQPIFHYAKMHGRAFLTGQAAKKLEEAASTRNDDAFITEVLGAIVYAGAAIIFERQKMEAREKALAALVIAQGQHEEKVRSGTPPFTLRDAVEVRRYDGADGRHDDGPVSLHDGPGGLQPVREPSDAAWNKIDPVRWAAAERQVQTHAAVDETAGLERRSKHHNKLTAPDAGTHPHKMHQRIGCEECASSICDRCRDDVPHRRVSDYITETPGYETDRQVFLARGGQVRG